MEAAAFATDNMEVDASLVAWALGLSNAERYRPVRPGRDIAPTVEHRNGTGQLMLTTDLGPLDVWCRLPDARGFAELFAATEAAALHDVAVRILQLEALIDSKASTGRAKDALVVPILREALRQREAAKRR